MASFWFLNKPMEPINALGVAIAMAGTILYNFSKNSSTLPVSVSSTVTTHSMWKWKILGACRRTYLFSRYYLGFSTKSKMETEQSTLIDSMAPMASPNGNTPVYAFSLSPFHGVHPSGSYLSNDSGCVPVISDKVSYSNPTTLIPLPLTASSLWCPFHSLTMSYFFISPFFLKK